MKMVWLDGSFLAEEKAMVPATDRAFLHGRGLFETLRAYSGIPFRLDDHLRRLTASAAHFKMRFNPPDLDPVVRELCGRNELDDAAIRITLSAEGRLLVTAKPRKPLPQSWYDRGAEVMVAPWRRDALFVGLKGELLEGAVTTIFLVVKGKLVTPKLPGILPGITRKVVMELIKVKERAVKIKELWKADEAFLTNALIEILPIGKPGPVGRKVADGYLQMTREIT